MTNNTETQRQLILKYLKSGNAITPFEALNLFGCQRLASRIHELKKIGCEIENIWLNIPGGKKVARYRFVK